MSDPSDARWRIPGKSLAYRYWALTRGMTMGVRAAVFDAAGRVLLIRHGYVAGWHFPGGGIERGESALDALRREVDEEAGLALAGTPALHGLFFNEGMRQRDHVAVYVVTAFERRREPKPNAEVREQAFFEPGALPDDTTGPTRRRLDEIAGRVPLSDRW